VSTGLGPVLAGDVASFDAHAGLGTVRSADGTVFPFHCIAIADGSRSIEVGVHVTFELLAKMGRYEATAVRPA
jgi:cold shock CspA family protein